MIFLAFIGLILALWVSYSIGYRAGRAEQFVIDETFAELKRHMVRKTTK